MHAPFNPPPLSPAGKPDSDSPAKRTPKAPKNKGGQAPTDKSRQPAAIASDPSGGPTRSSELPNFATAPESVDPVTAGAPTANPFADPAAGAGQGGWVQLPNAAVRQSDAEALNGRGGEGGPGIARTGAANLDAGDLVESVPHVVASGRKLLLDRAASITGRADSTRRSGRPIATRCRRRRSSGSARRSGSPPPRRSTVRRSSPPDDPWVWVPVGLCGATHAAVWDRRRPVLGGCAGAAGRRPVQRPQPPRRRPVAGQSRRVPAASASDRPRLPRYKIRPQETLRSIARDTLGDSRRAGEILELNREVIDDPNYLTPGQEIELPEDARLARRVR